MREQGDLWCKPISPSQGRDNNWSNKKIVVFFHIIPVINIIECDSPGYSQKEKKRCIPMCSVPESQSQGERIQVKTIDIGFIQFFTIYSGEKFQGQNTIF